MTFNQKLGLMRKVLQPALAMTEQEIFDKVAEHLQKQGRCAMGEDGFCVYRGEEGTKCAVGALIPDELYDSNIEGVTVADIPRYDDTEEDARKLVLLGRLQRVHDNGYPWLLASVAEEYELDTAVLDAKP